MRDVHDSDATLILNIGELNGGSLETLQSAEPERKPHSRRAFKQSQLKRIFNRGLYSDAILKWVSGRSSRAGRATDSSVIAQTN